jgi:inhibitor of cysteine peptidase
MIGSSRRALGTGIVIGWLCAAGPCGCMGAAADRPPVVQVTEKDNGRTVQLTAGAELVLRLHAQLGTGFGWKVAENDARVLSPEGEPGTEREGEPKPGGAEVQVFRFRAASTGSAGLALVYARPWERNVPPAKTFHLAVRVTSPPA